MKAAKVAGCGTNAGFHAHRSRGESPCDDCKAARAERERTNRARRLAQGSFSHGTHTGWDSGCRCDACMDHHRTRGRAQYARTRRREANS